MPPRKASPSTPLDFSYLTPQPFSNSKFKQNQSKRNKTLKQILAGERERSDRLNREKREREIMNKELIATGRAVMEERLEIMNYNSMDAPPSLLPSKKYCDVTGLEAPYVDPKSTLRFHNAEVYEVIKTFSPGVIEVYKTVRGAGTVLR